MYLKLDIFYSIILTSVYAAGSSNKKVYEDETGLKQSEAVFPTILQKDNSSEGGSGIMLKGSGGDVSPQKVGKEATFLWRNGDVKYYIDDESYDDIIHLRIRKAMDIIQSASCVVFTKLLDEPKVGNLGVSGETWLHFTNPYMEWDCVHGTKTGKRGEAIMTLGFDCMRESDIIHALLHVLGFKDEVTHPQRDSFVRIQWQNIQPQYHPLFQIQNPPPSYQTLAEYDTMSIMHFHDRAYTMNGGATIVPLIPGLQIKPSISLSLLDKMKLGLVYGQECNRRNVDNLLETCKNTLVDGDEEANMENYGEVAETDNILPGCIKNKTVTYDEDAENMSEDGHKTAEAAEEE